MSEVTARVQVRREVLAFGPFHLDVAQMQLRKKGQRVRLSAGLTRLLILFTSRPGELITREEVAACLWRESQHVDFTSGINTAVRRLRAALGDGANAPIYIETVVGVGYRFLADIEVRASVSQTLRVMATSLPGNADTSDAGFQLPANGSALPDEVLAQHVVPPTNAALEERVTTTERDPTRQNSRPSESVPGKQSEGAGTRWVWPLVVGAVVLAILFVAGRFRPVPFHSSAAPLHYEHIAQVTFVPSGDEVQAATLSHDGRLLAFSNSKGLFVSLLERQVNRKLAPLPDLASIQRLVWFRGDQVVLASGTDLSGHSQVWTVSLNGQDSRVLLPNAADADVSRDGARVAFTRQDASELWVANSDGTKPRILLKGDEHRSFLQPFWSPDGSSLRCQVRSIPQDSRDLSQTSNFAWALDTFSVSNGRLLDDYKGLNIQSAAILPTGRLYFNAVPPGRDLSPLTIYAVPTDPHTGRFLGTPEPAATPLGASLTGLSASDDGEELGFILHRHDAQVHTARISSGGLRLSDFRTLVHPAPDNYPQAWTPKQDAVIFESDDLDKYALYKQSLDGSQAVLFARSVGGAVLPQVTPDDRWVLFANLKLFHPDSIYRVPIEGGSELYDVPTHGKVGEFRCSESPKGRCVFQNKEGEYFVFYELDPIDGIGRELGRARWVQSALGSWSLSFDGRTVALPTNEGGEPSIELVALESGRISTTRVIRIPERWTIMQATWAPDSHGFYVESRDHLGYSLSFVDLGGSPTLLRQSAGPIWAVPSPDGTKLAFPELDPSTNVWIARR